jgi:hypothetical protein
MVYADPTAIEKGVLVVGGQPKAPPAASSGADAGKPKTASAATKDDKPAKPATTKDSTDKPTAKPAEPAQEVKKEATATAEPEVQASPAAAVTVVANGPGAPAVAVFAQAPPGVLVPGQAPAPTATPPQGPKASAPNTQPAKTAEPKAKIPLDEVESIRFERTPALAGRFMGQPNLDFTMPGRGAKKDEAAPKGETKKPTPGDDVLAPPPGTAQAERIAAVEAKKNGIRDMHIWLFNLRESAIKQINVNCQTDKGPAGWRLDTSDSQDSPLVIHRSGKEISADLYLEPPEADCFQKDFMINIMYEDGQAANVSVKAGEHTDAKKAIDPKAPSVERLDAWVYLAGDDRYFGKLESLSEEILKLTTPWNERVQIPLARIAGIRLGVPDRKETAASFARRLKNRGSEDLLLARSKDGEVVAVPGITEGTEDDKLRFRFQEKSRTLPLSLVEGVVLAARPESKSVDELRPTFHMTGPLVISGRWKDLDSASWKVEAPWGQTLSLPAAEVESARFRGGRMTYLSDLVPSKVEETPYFGHRLPWRADISLTGEPLKMNGQTYERGIAVHSRCILTYDLNGEYATFEALVGFDDAAQGKGQVECRVLADGKELYANGDLRADTPPLKLALKVERAEQLRLVVDFGKAQDTGDRVIWANPKLFRKPGESTANRSGSQKK